MSVQKKKTPPPMVGWSVETPSSLRVLPNEPGTVLHDLNADD